MKSQINRKKIKKILTKKKNKVYLFIKNLRTLWLNWKLDYKKVEFFIIKNKKSNIIFKLELSEEIKIHPIFYILLLESVNSNILI